MEKIDYKSVVLVLISQHKDRENTIKQSELCKLTGCPDTYIRDFVRQLRAEGHPICSNAKGYWYTTNRRDIEETIAILSEKMLTIANTIRTLQMHMEDRHEF